MMRNISIIKKSYFLISLALLCPEIVASKPLDLNYNNSSDLALNPRLSLLTKACHTLADPIQIEFHFKPLMSTKTTYWKLTIKGAEVTKGYAKFSSASANIDPHTDPELLIPFKMSVNGTIDLTGQTFGYDITTSEGEQTYNKPFCFAEGYSGNVSQLNPTSSTSTFGLFPLFRTYPSDKVFGPRPASSDDAIAKNEREFSRLCGSRSIYKDPEYIWTGQNGTFPFGDDVKLPEAVQKGIKDYGKDFLTSVMFFYDDAVVTSTTHYPPSTMHYNKDLTPSNEKGTENNDGSITYVFPLRFPDNGSMQTTYLNQGDFILELSNRNITSLKLEEMQSPLSSSLVIFEWERDNNSLNNVLAHKNLKKEVRLVTGGDIPDDPYQKKSFYNEALKVSNSSLLTYFRGTLVDSLSLSDNYNQFNKNNPVSLPSERMGNINLVNTDYLIFLIGQDLDYGGDPTITVYGQPLKFGPLYSGNKEEASAMQVRNTCY